MEMMECYEEVHIGASTQKPQHTSQRAVEIHETTLSSNCSSLITSNKQNFDFGAEIAESTEIRDEFKTYEKVGETAAVATVAVATSSAHTSPTDDPLAQVVIGNIETPLNVATITTNQECGMQNGNINGKDDEEDDAGDDDSCQSDGDDDEQEQDDILDVSVESQKRDCNPENMSHEVGTSQDSDDDESTSDSDFSDLSGLSDMSGREWKPISARPINWVQKQIHAGANPRELLSQMLPSNAQPIAPGVNDMLLWRILASMLSEPPRRQKLRYINTFEDVIQLIEQSNNIIVLTGAGVSVSCGIPDFRSSDGIYSRLAKDFPNLPDPQAMFDINYFSRDPRPFYKFAREIYPGQFKPSPCHRFIKLLEQKQKLLRNYTQNIDTLEQVAGIKNVIECHGSFSTASCTKCKVKCTADAIREDIFSQRIPVCRRCQPNVHQSVNASDAVSDANLRQLVENGIMKPDIVFFGEGLPEEFHTVMASDKDKCDLLIVIGSSLKVRPVALIPSSIPSSVPQILINREQLHHLEFDVELLGDSDVIINQLCHRLGSDWKAICYDDIILKESKELMPLEMIDANDESEEDGLQMLDTDTQSIKSSASTDIALRSAATCSDSGFESSTSSGMVLATKESNIPTLTMATNATICAATEVNDTIGKTIVSTMEQNQPITAIPTETEIVFTTPRDTERVNEYLEEPIDAVDFESRSFQPFNARVSEPLRSNTYPLNARHLSIDSSKDSGIQGDSSNPALITTTATTNIVGSLAPPVTNFGDSGGTPFNDDAPAGISSITCANQKHTATAIPASASAPAQNADTSRKATSNEKRNRTASERLFEGTYYAHDSSSAYVFPGAQVSWWADAEDDEDLGVENGNEYIDEGADQDENITDMNGAPLSPLMPPSVEAEVVNEITTTNAFALCAIKPTTLHTNNQQDKLTHEQTLSVNDKLAQEQTLSSVNIPTTTPIDRISDMTIAQAPTPLSSPQKRALTEATPSALTSNNGNTCRSNVSSSSSCCCDSGAHGKLECICSLPPAKRKRSTDDGDKDDEDQVELPAVQTTKNLTTDAAKLADFAAADSNSITTVANVLTTKGTADAVSAV